MKRSEMIEHIQAELRETMQGLSVSNEKINQYFWRRSESLLDMIEGFGMSPPSHSSARLDNGIEVRLMDWEEEES